MLYDPKWEAKADPFTLASLIAWLEQQPRWREYDFSDNHGCLICQYFDHIGLVYAGVGNGYWRKTGGAHADLTCVKTPLPEGFNEIALGYPRTFGGALKRAQTALASAE